MVRRTTHMVKSSAAVVKATTMATRKRTTLHWSAAKATSQATTNTHEGEGRRITRVVSPDMADSTESSIVIEADAGTVLDVIADLEAYPEWASELTEVEILTEEGDGWPDRVRLTMDAGIIKDTYTLDYDWDVLEDGTGTVSWSLVEASVLRAMDGTYTLTPADDGGTDVSYRLSVDLKIPVLGMLKRKAEKVIIDTALKGLKKRVESL